MSTCQTTRLGEIVCELYRFLLKKALNPRKQKGSWLLNFLKKFSTFFHISQTKTSKNFKNGSFQGLSKRRYTKDVEAFEFQSNKV
jgi:hypothetical protein